VVGDPAGAAMTTPATPLPELLDCRSLMLELGVRRATAEAIIRQLPIVQIPGLRKSYVRRGDVLALIEANTYTNDQVPA
jgi:hypothetical protein